MADKNASKDKPAPAAENPAPAQEAGAPAAAETPAAESSTTESAGQTVRRAITMRNFVDVDWINKNVVAGGKGTRKPICRIFGFVLGVSERPGQLPDGTPSVNIVCNGQFESQSYITGEVSNAASVFFPGSFAEYIKGLFGGDNPPRMVEIDVDVAVEATGKAIPFSYHITNYREGADLTPLKKLKASRKLALALPAAAPTPALENKA